MWLLFKSTAIASKLQIEPGSWFLFILVCLGHEHNLTYYLMNCATFSAVLHWQLRGFLQTTEVYLLQVDKVSYLSPIVRLSQQISFSITKICITLGTKYIRSPKTGNIVDEDFWKLIFSYLAWKPDNKESYFFPNSF